VRAVAEAARFSSRAAAAPKPETQSKRAARRYRTGRNVQFNVKANQETVDAIYAITEAHPGWVLWATHYSARSKLCNANSKASHEQSPLLQSPV
jgi:hypothetical protein